MKGIYYVNILKTNNMAKKYSLSKRDFDTHKAKLQKFFKEINLLPCAFATCHYSFHASRNNLQLTTTVKKKIEQQKGKVRTGIPFHTTLYKGSKKVQFGHLGRVDFLAGLVVFQAHLLNLWVRLGPVQSSFSQIIN